uniref:N-acetyltransferase domain-containing protein n=1 Tax=Trichogramma kaykai TaxID=54128 RepID=A0ABD2VTZ1_9HYME
MAYFSDNAISHFTTHLPKEIRLTGDNWSVGLVEIHVPNTLEHVSDEEAVYSFDNSRDNVLHRFKSGNFQNLEDLIASINDSPDFSEHLEIAPSLMRSGYYTIERICSCTKDHEIIFHNKILDVLGFERAPRMILSPTSKRAIEATRPASLVLPVNDQLYVYCDVCLPSFVGDTQSSLLRIVTLDSSKTSFGRSIVRYFAPPHYVPVLHRNFQTISLDIRTSHGVNPPFTSGTLLLGGGIRNVYVGAPRQRGRGVGGWLGGIFRTIIPYIKSGAKAVGKEAARAGVQILSDMSRGDMTLHESVRARSRESGRKLAKKAGEKLSNIMKGRGYKTRRKSRGNQSKKKRSSKK